MKIIKGKKFLDCGGKQYRNKNDTIVLPIEIKGLLSEIIIDGKTFFVKRSDSLHISLVCIGEIISKHGIVVQNFKQKVLKDFCEFVKENDIKFLKCRDEFRHVKRDEMESIIVMCDVSNLDKFFKIINAKYNLNIQTQTTHITLYTMQELGIFVTDSQDIANMTKLIDVPLEVYKALGL